jgi:hypothetical protein
MTKLSAKDITSRIAVPQNRNSITGSRVAMVIEGNMGARSRLLFVRIFPRVPCDR